MTRAQRAEHKENNTVKPASYLPTLQRALPILLTATAVVFLFHWLKSDLRIFRVASPDNVNLILLLCVLGLGLPGNKTPAAFRILLAYITASMSLYVLTGYALHDLKVGHPAADLIWIPLVFAVLSYWRPTLALLPLMAVMWAKILARKDFGIAISSTDYMAVVEIGVFLCLITIPASIFTFATSTPIGARFKNQDLVNQYLNVAILLATAVHLSNYFYSGHQKVILENGGPLTWVWENPTYILSAITHDFGYLTIFEIPWLPDFFNVILEFLNRPLNAAVLAAQLLALVVIFSRRAVIVVTVFFDMMHLAIFGLTAIFFWKWIVLNLGIVHAFKRLYRDKWRIPFWTSLAAMIMVLAAPQVFQVAHLGWFDSGGVNHAHWQVETKDGRRIEVPTNFFLGKSISFAQQRPGRPFDAFFPTHDWGTSMDAKVMEQFTNNCTTTRDPNPQLQAEKVAIAADYVRRHHARVLELVGGSGNFSYDLYPHHIWSSPFSFTEFRALDLSEVVAYVFVVEAKCVRVAEGGAVEVQKIAEQETRIPL